MDKELWVGIFTVVGAIVGGILGGGSTILAARVGQKWEEAKKDIVHLCDQVAAYHKLEDVYANEIARLEPTRGKSNTIKKEMRSVVEASFDVVYPKMTADQAQNSKARWA